MFVCIYLQYFFLITKQVFFFKCRPSVYSPDDNLIHALFVWSTVLASDIHCTTKLYVAHENIIINSDNYHY